MQIGLKATSSPRLLALWERPPFAWTIVDQLTGSESGAAAYLTRLRALLETMASWPETRRIGLYTAASIDQLNHPPQTTERLERSLETLREGGMEEQNQLCQPILLQWS